MNVINAQETGYPNLSHPLGFRQSVLWIKGPHLTKLARCSQTPGLQDCEQ